MALSNDTGIENTHINIIEGTFRVKSSENNPKAESRINKKGDKVWELKYTSLVGFISKIETEETDYGRKVIFTIKDDKDYKLNLGYADGLTSNIYKMLPNIDPSKKVNFVLTRKPDDKGTPRTSIFISQDGSPVKWAYTRDNKNGMPDLEKIMVKGKEQWDNTKQVDFLWLNAVEPFKAKIPSKFDIPSKDEIATVHLDDEVETGGFNADDIPF